MTRIWFHNDLHMNSYISKWHKFEECIGIYWWFFIITGVDGLASCASKVWIQVGNAGAPTQKLCQGYEHQNDAGEASCKGRFLYNETVGNATAPTTCLCIVRQPRYPKLSASKGMKAERPQSRAPKMSNEHAGNAAAPANWLCTER